MLLRKALSGLTLVPLNLPLARTELHTNLVSLIYLDIIILCVNVQELKVIILVGNNQFLYIKIKTLKLKIFLLMCVNFLNLKVTIVRALLNTLSQLCMYLVLRYCLLS